jgi:glycosyltransferase involved in cell wall biosynthesis
MNTNNPRVSIGLPVYNAENFLKKALDSILNQTFEDFELIISDNASIDKTEEICRKYAAKDHRIRYYRNEQNLGAARNYNRVVELSKGEYFKWANHDDLCAPEFLERCIEVLDNNPNAILAYPRTIIINERGCHIEKLPTNLDINLPKPHERFKRYRILRRGKKLETQQYWRAFLYMPIYGVIRASLLKKTGLIGGYIASDEILLDELALLGEFHEVSDYLFFKRKHIQNTIVYREYDKRIVWFDPMSKDRKLLFPHWRLFIERFFAINRVSISFYEKILCYIEMAKYFITNWKNLAKELIINLGRFLNINSISLFGFKKELPKIW